MADRVLTGCVITGCVITGGRGAGCPGGGIVVCGCFLFCNSAAG
jgi:hypothetical protein